MLHIGDKVRLIYNNDYTGIVKASNHLVTTVQSDHDGKFYDLLTDRLEIIENIQHIQHVNVNPMDSWTVKNLGTIYKE